MNQKLDFLTKDLIDQAVLEIDKNGVPDNRQGTEYAVSINGKNYPFKYIITEAAKLANVNLIAGDFSSNAHYRAVFKEMSGYPIVNLNHKMDYFDLIQLHNYKNDIGKPYDSDNLSTKLYFDTRKKLQYLGDCLSKELGIPLKNNYNEKPNKMAGQGKGFVLKEYILTGFLPSKYSKFGNSVFLKMTFHGFQSNFQFGFDIDVNFSDENNTFNQFRDQFQKEVNWKIPVDNTFPKNWNDLIEIATPIFKKQVEYLERFLSNKKEMSELNSYIKILKHKKQIILQGPPGTGKTYTAKKIAEQLAGRRSVSKYNALTVEIIIEALEVGQKIANASGKQDYYTINSINDENVELQSERSQPWKPKYKNIISKYNELVEGEKPSNVHAFEPYELAVAKYLYKLIKPSKVKTESNFTLVQFHPSYSYEDFVRGISVKNENDSIIYKTENKVIAKLSELASKKNALEDYNIPLEYRSFLHQKGEEAEHNGTHYYFNKEKTIRLKDVPTSETDVGRMRYETLADNGNWYMATWVSIENKYNLDNWNDPAYHKLDNFNNASHYAIWQDFDAFVKKLQNNDYVLIIDEINRANLPSVLGELIYAIEYRGEPVNSMYAIDGDSAITIPENLYIIGTMNTADRSVGHIDYAIKRRFAFVDVPPNAQVIIYDKAKALFGLVSELFEKKNNYLASDFESKDVKLGHSYFLLDNKSDLSESEQLQLKLDYEILPILNEYIKDGLLLETAKDKLKEISEFEC
ncbi:AAA family ATPase [Lacinutrix chionoecetis]